MSARASDWALPDEVVAVRPVPQTAAVPQVTPFSPCLIVNPRSRNASRGLAADATALALTHGAEVVSVESPAATRSAVEAILARRQQPLIVLAGDGTACAIVDQLSQLTAGAWTPDLLVLAGGRTNLTAVDLGAGGAALPILKRALLRTTSDAAVEERCALRIEQPGSPTRHGFFLAAAVIDSVIRQCHRQRANGILQGDVGTFIYLLQLGLRGLSGRSGLSCPPLHVDAGECGRQQGAIRMLLATTLLHRKGFLNPYAARGAGEVRLTSVSANAPRFWRSLPRLVSGRYSPAMTTDNGYLSGRCEHVQINGLTHYMLDGEPFEADPSRPVTISAGRRLRFMVP